jgi:hypothetical protein
LEKETKMCYPGTNQAESERLRQASQGIVPAYGSYRFKFGEFRLQQKHIAGRQSLGEA